MARVRMDFSHTGGEGSGDRERYHATALAHRSNIKREISSGSGKMINENARKSGPRVGER